MNIVIQHGKPRMTIDKRIPALVETLPGGGRLVQRLARPRGREGGGRQAHVAVHLDVHARRRHPANGRRRGAYRQVRSRSRSSTTPPPSTLPRMAAQQPTLCTPSTCGGSSGWWHAHAETYHHRPSHMVELSTPPRLLVWAITHTHQFPYGSNMFSRSVNSPLVLLPCLQLALRALRFCNKRCCHNHRQSACGSRERPSRRDGHRERQRRIRVYAAR